MAIDNRDIQTRDLIAEAIHGEMDPNCDHDTGVGTWTGAPNADQCVSMAQNILDWLGEHDVHVVKDEGARDGHKHEVMFVDANARAALRARLMEPDMRGVGYSEFITRAVANVETTRG